MKLNCNQCNESEKWRENRQNFGKFKENGSIERLSHLNVLFCWHYYIFIMCCLHFFVTFKKQIYPSKHLIHLFRQKVKFITQNWANVEEEKATQQNVLLWSFIGAAKSWRVLYLLSVDWVWLFFKTPLHISSVAYHICTFSSWP